MDEYVFPFLILYQFRAFTKNHTKLEKLKKTFS
jgi:hypothetical protein